MLAGVGQKRKRPSDPQWTTTHQPPTTNHTRVVARDAAHTTDETTIQARTTANTTRTVCRWPDVVRVNWAVAGRVGADGATGGLRHWRHAFNRRKASSRVLMRALWAVRRPAMLRGADGSVSSSRSHGMSWGMDRWTSRCEWWSPATKAGWHVERSMQYLRACNQGCEVNAGKKQETTET